MTKIVGSYIFLFFVTIVSPITAEITLRVLDSNRVALTQAGAGHPFVVDVQINDMPTVGQMPMVRGLDQHAVKNSGMRISSINGKTTANYSFEVRIDKPGTYVLGPAVVTDRGSQIESNSVSITVGNQQMQKESSGKKKNETAVLLRLSVDKSRVVVGQQIRCSLRFYYTNPDISLRQLIEQDSKEISRSKVEGPTAGAENMNGIDYHYVEWSWYCYPKVAGSLMIPAYGADYERQIERDDFWSGLGRLFGSHLESKRIYSNAVSLTVDPLPVSKKSPNAIGHYTSFSISATPSVARQGEGIIVALELVGQGDPEAVIFNGLEQMPPELKFYESKRCVVAKEDGKQQTIRCEYIVQGLKPGTWHIPAQSFYYFDTEKKSFHTLSTSALSLGILQNMQASSSSMHKHSELLALHMHPYCPAKTDTHMPWLLFVVLWMIPFFIVGYRFFHRAMGRKWQKSSGSKRAQRAFITAKKQLEICKQSGRDQDIYTLFIECFSHRWHQPAGTITLLVISERLFSAGMKDKELLEWQRFFNTITQRAFSMQSVATDNHLFTQAELWIKRLEKLL